MTRQVYRKSYVRFYKANKDGLTSKKVFCWSPRVEGTICGNDFHDVSVAATASVFVSFRVYSALFIKS